MTIGELKNTGEEFNCAQVIDSMSHVEFWIRNLERRDNAFWIPLAGRRFFPDFVCKLKDGRILVVEYKGDAYKTNDDSKEKNQIGLLWADKSEGKCLFIMAVKDDAQGRNVDTQIRDLIEK